MRSHAPRPASKVPGEELVVHVPVKAVFLGKLDTHDVCAIEASRNWREKALHTSCSTARSISFWDYPHAKVDDIGLVCMGHHKVQCPRCKLIILVNQHNMGSARGCHSRLSRTKCADVCVEKNRPHSRVTLSKRQDDIPSIVSRGVVHQEKLELGKGLPEDAHCTFLKVSSPVVCGDYNRERERLGHRISCPARCYPSTVSPTCLLLVISM